MMANYNLGLLNYTTNEIEAMEEALLKYYDKEQVIELIENREFVLYNNCYTLEDIIKYTELEYGCCPATAQEIDANNVWLETKLGIIISEF